jgi:hypothetical protein
LELRRVFLGFSGRGQATGFYVDRREHSQRAAGCAAHGLATAMCLLRNNIEFVAGAVTILRLTLAGERR